MPKIKEIGDRLIKNPWEYNEIRFLVAKRTLAFFIMLYFMSFLFTIGGFRIGPVSLEMLGGFVFHVYSILILVIGWFLYELSHYASYVYVGWQKWPIFLMSSLSVVFVVFALLGHLKIAF